MFDVNINQLIKSPCGRTKYKKLAEKKGLFPKIRLIWFVIFATIRDWQLANPDQSADSNS